MTKAPSRIHLMGAASAFALAALSHPAFAQTAAPRAANSGGVALEEVVVTARLRVENLQSVPAAITVLSGTQVENAHITSVTELGASIPNVAIERLPTGGGTIKASIRGISFGDNRLTFEPVVGVVIDNIFLGTSAGSDIDPFDIESIQVLRGPQGTLFGRNTVAGAIVVTRNKPTGEFGGSADLRYGSYNLFEQRLILNFDKIGDVSTKIYLNNGDQDSFAKNTHTGKRGKLFSHFYAGGSAIYKPADNFDIQLNIDYSKLKEFPVLVQMTPEKGYIFCSTFTQAAFAGTPYAENGCRSTGYDIAAAHDFKVTTQLFPAYARTEAFSSGLQINWRPGDGNIVYKSITGVVRVHQVDGGNLIDDQGIPVGPGGTLVSLSDYGQTTHYQQISQEFRIEANPLKQLKVVGGLFYFHSTFDSGPVVLLTGQIGNQNTRGVVSNRRTFGQTLDSYAVFADGTYDLTDKIHLSLGGRVTVDKKAYNTNVLIGSTEPGGKMFVEGSKSWQKPTGRAAVNYDITDDATVYGSWSRGFRSGGFNSRANSIFQAQIPFNPETVDSFEVGLRSEFFDHRLRFNPTIFSSVYNDRQETIFVPDGKGFFSNVIDNAGQQKFKGVEFEAIGKITERLVVRVSGGYTDAKITKLTTIDPATGKTIDVSNQRQVVFAPKYTYALGADYTMPVGGNGDELIFNALYSFRDWMYSDPIIPSDATKGHRSPLGLNWIPAVKAADFTLTYRHRLDGERKLALSVYAKDAFDPKVARIDHEQAIAGTFAYGELTPTRQFGVEARLDF